MPETRCRFAYGSHGDTATHCLLLQQIHTGFTVLVPANLGNLEQMAIKRVLLLLFLLAKHNKQHTVFKKMQFPNFLSHVVEKH